MLKAIKSKFQRKKRNLHKNLKYLLIKNNIDMTTLAAETGLPKTSVFRMKSEEYNPTLSSLEPIAEFFRVEIGDLLYGDLSQENDHENALNKVGEVTYLPVYEQDKIKDWPIKLEQALFIGTTGHLGKDSFGLRITTDAMSPIFFKNTIVVIDVTLEPKDGDYILCQLNNTPIPVIRQVFMDGSTYFFKPLNPHYGDMECIRDYQINGIIVKSIENYR